MEAERTTPQVHEPQPVLEEFSILELEERLEFAMCCDDTCGPNTNCSCPKPPTRS